jgi:hypothetical protein
MILPDAAKLRYRVLQLLAVACSCLQLLAVDIAAMVSLVLLIGGRVIRPFPTAAIACFFLFAMNVLVVWIATYQRLDDTADGAQCRPAYGLSSPLSLLRELQRSSFHSGRRACHTLCKPASPFCS